VRFAFPFAVQLSTIGRSGRSCVGLLCRCLPFLELLVSLGEQEKPISSLACGMAAGKKVRIGVVLVGTLIVITKISAVDNT